MSEALTQLISEGTYLSNNLLQSSTKLYNYLAYNMKIKGLECKENIPFNNLVNNFLKTHTEDFYCEECNGKIKETENNTYVCVDCGLVQDNQDARLTNQERRAYGRDETEKKKISEPVWREFGSRTTLPVQKNKTKSGYSKIKDKTLYNRLGKIQSSLVSSLERNFWEAKPKMKMYASKLNLPPHVHETAWNIYRPAAEKKLTMGRSIEGFILASIYAAIRISELPRTLEDVLAVTTLERKPVHNSLKHIIKEVLPGLGLKYKPITAEVLIYKFGDELKLSMQVQNKAKEMLITATKKGLKRTGKDPKGLAAAALYITAKKLNEKRTQNEVSETTTITEVTLRSRAKDIKEVLKISL